MKLALRHPALQAASAVGALFALTWPLLVFDRPLYVLASFFAIWALIIGLLFAFSMACQDGPVTDGGAAGDSEGPDDRGD